MTSFAGLGSRLRRFMPLLPLVGLIGLAVARPGDDGLTICPFARCTGMACPGCGLTRGVSALLHGDASTSWRYHPLTLVILVEGLVMWGWWAALRWGWTERQPSYRVINRALGATAALLVALWIGRWVTGTLPPV